MTSSNGTQLSGLPYFTFGLPFHVMFFEWFVDTERELMWSCARVFIMAASYQGFKVLRAWLRKRASRQCRRHMIPVKQFQIEGYRLKRASYIIAHVFNRYHFLQSMLEILQTTLGIWLVMIYMTYNAWLAIYVSLGSAFGYFMFAWICPSG